MKQLTIYFSADLEGSVIAALERADVSGFFRLDGCGTRFLDAGKVPRSVSWEAGCVIVPGAQDAAVDAVVEELGHLRDACEVEPCIRIVVSSIDRVV